MFDHVTIRCSDRAASERFYGTVLNSLGVDESYRTNAFSEWRDFLLAAAGPGDPPTSRLHMGFVASSRAQVDAFWEAGIRAGYADDGRPAPRPEYGPDYYGGFLLDPDGNSAEAVNHDTLRQGGIVDHLWIRVSDLERSAAFYETIAPHAGFSRRHHVQGRVQFAGSTGTFSLVDGAPTEHLHMAFGTDEDDSVHGFHRAAVEAGYPSNGPPGERPRYHPGYFAAYVLDPDGNNIELVNHHRR